VTIEGTQSSAQSVLIDGPGSGIFTNTQGSGVGGNIFVKANSVKLQNGGTLSAKTSGIEATATGGSITVTTTDHVTMTGGASITASSTDPGNADAGNIKIIAGQQFDMRDSSVTAKATQASGGNIDIRAVDRVRLVKSEISSSVQGGASTTGGNIMIDPNVVVLQNSQITAQAAKGAGGNITIFTPLFLAAGSQVSASSQFGVDGTVTIQSPTSNLSESLGTLPLEPGQAQTLVTQRCAALANGQTSSFVVAGREQLPADPGGWLTSPLAFAEIDADSFTNETVATIPAIMATHGSGTVSLRRLTPDRFLMANFVDSEATGCRS
jgi:large exoprotein involved in heme utilization and adhesion